MKKILKYKNEILIALGLAAIYFILRIILLGNFPIFTDEAIYVRWTQVAANDANWRFISLTDGKQPMFIWAGMPLVKIISDPLVALRLVSVVSGFFTLVGLWLLTYELFRSRKIAFLSTLLYVFYPFAVVYDRMALYDSMVSTFAIWAAYFSILLVRRLRLDVAYTLGAIIGGGLLTKTNANFNIILLPFTLLLFNFKDKEWKRKLLKWGVFALVAVAIAEVMYNSLRLSPFFHIIKEKNTIFVYYPFSIPIEENIKVFLGNLRGLVGWLATYLTPSYLILILISLVSKKFIRERLFLVLYFAAPFLALALFGKAIFPRFIFFMSLYLIPLASLGLFNLNTWAVGFVEKRGLKVGGILTALILILVLLYPAKISLDFIFNPMSAQIADADQRQYVSLWPSGVGVRESIDFFDQESKKGKIFVATQGTFGLMPYALDVYLGKNSNIEIKGYWPIKDEMPDELLDKAYEMPTYVIFYQPCPSCKFDGDAPDQWPLKLIKNTKKSKNVYYSIYKVEIR